MTTAFHLIKIESEFNERRKRNSAFSLRAYSKFLGLQPAVLSSILKGSRGLPLKYVDKISDRLKLTPTEKLLFLQSVLLQKNSSLSIKADLLETSEKIREIVNEEIDYKIIAEWEYYAILSLMDTKSFKSDMGWIANRLGLPMLRVQSVLQHLEDRGYIAKKSEKFIKLKSNLSTTKEISSSAIREGHKKIMELAINKIDTIPVDQRFYFSSSIAVTMEKLPLAKEMIRRFSRELNKVLETTESTEVYHYGFQLYPVTK